MTTAVLLTCHGTVDRPEDIPAFISAIRRGRPAPPELIEEVRHRFDRIGGSPLMRITEAQAAALAERLGLPVRFAGRLWRPYPKEILAELRMRWPATEQVQLQPDGGLPREWRRQVRFE